MYVEYESVCVCPVCEEFPWSCLSCVSGQQVGCAMRETSDHFFPTLRLPPWAASIASPLMSVAPPPRLPCACPQCILCLGPELPLNRGRIRASSAWNLMAPTWLGVKPSPLWQPTWPRPHPAPSFCPVTVASVLPGCLQPLSHCTKVPPPQI